MAARWGTIAALAWRESRTARRRLALYMSSISLGVAALVAIDSFAANVQDSIRQQSRALLGGDVSFSSRAPWTPALDSLLDSLNTASGVTVARSANFGSMATTTRSANTRLAQVKAVSGTFPLYGDVETAPAGRWGTLQEGANAIVDPSLLLTLGAEVGDTLALGYARFLITGTIRVMPGDGAFTGAFAPRIYIPERYVGETQLLGFGSRADYAAYVRLTPGTASGTWVAKYRARFEKAQARVQTVTESERSFTEAIGQMADFLGVVGLIALLLGGIGVASGVNAFVARKVDTVAVLRCLGATGAQVLAIYVAQAIAMGFLGAAAGVALGIAIQFALPLALKGFLPVDVSVALDPTAIALGLGIGVWVALIFALRPLLALRRVSPLAALRRDAAVLDAARRADVLTQLVNLALIGSVIALAFARGGNARNGLIFTIGIALAIGILWAAASALVWLARKMVRARWPYVARQGVANLHRPANQTRAVVLALGFGAFLVSTLLLVQRSLGARFESTAAESRGNVIFFDVQDDQRVGVERTVTDAKQAIISSTPIVTMRIKGINGDLQAHLDKSRLPASFWAVRREYRSTYRDTMVATEKLRQGKWFGKNGTLPDTMFELSLEQDVAQNLKVQLGDIITWDVQGVPVTTKLTSLR
ncbi:MAG: ABC transporter permease, partial [Gemmatimonadaceae bacterium]|nr:ABC transporter permease [Gemmatimonadaceae bacterium]